MVMWRGRDLRVSKGMIRELTVTDEPELTREAAFCAGQCSAGATRDQNPYYGTGLEAEWERGRSGVPSEYP